MDNTTFKYQVLKRYANDYNISDIKSIDDTIENETEIEFIAVLTRAFEEEVSFRYSEFNVFPVEIIIDYIQRTHKMYLTKVLNEIEQSLALLNQAYPAGHELLELLNNFYLDYKSELIHHIKEENEKLIPHILYLNSCVASTFDVYEFHRRKNNFSIEDFFENHEDNDSDLEMIREKIMMYEPPQTNRFIYGVLLNQFELFEQDLHVHGLIEEQVLIPRALEIEHKLTEKFLKLVTLN